MSQHSKDLVILQLTVTEIKSTNDRLMKQLDQKGNSLLKGRDYMYMHLQIQFFLLASSSIPSGHSHLTPNGLYKQR